MVSDRDCRVQYYSRLFGMSRYHYDKQSILIQFLEWKIGGKVSMTVQMPFFNAAKGSVEVSGVCLSCPIPY